MQKDYRYDINPAMKLCLFHEQERLDFNVYRIESSAEWRMFAHITISQCRRIFELEILGLDGYDWFDQWEEDKNLEIVLKPLSTLSSQFQNGDNFVQQMAKGSEQISDSKNWVILEIMQNLVLPWDENETVQIGIRLK